MIKKYNLFDIGGELIHNDDICLIRENKELDNIWVWSVVIFREKALKKKNYLDQDSAYIFFDGKGVFECENEIVYVNPNDIIFVPKNSWHRVINTGDTHLRFVILAERN